MAIKASNPSSQTAAIIQFHKSKLVWGGLIGSGLILLLSLAVRSTGSDSGSQPPVVIQPAPAPMPAPQPKLEMREIPIQPNCWSELIEIGPNDKWTLSRPGWIEYLLEDGGKIYVPDQLNFNAKKMCGDRFRIRGERGVVKIFIEH